MSSAAAAASSSAGGAFGAVPLAVTQTMGTILCCMCGTPIRPNTANMCVDCLRSKVDITENIPKQLTISWCKGCGRYLNPPRQWVNAQLESRELLVLCLKRVKGLNKVKLVDANFIWTEPHSKRLKVKLTVQAEVINGAVLQQTFIAEFVVQNNMCMECHREAAKDHWVAIVQVRQRVDHKRTFLFLEQMLLRNRVHKDATNIKERADGLDFYFQSKNHGRRFVDFLTTVLGVRYKVSERLISADLHSNTAKVKYSFSVEVPPICKDDLVLLPRKTASMFGGISPLVLCVKMSNQMHFCDPFTGQTADLNGVHYWRTPFMPLMSYANLVEFVVIDIEPLSGEATGKYRMANATVAHVSDFGSNDRQYLTRTHLGHVLQAGDLVYGFDISSTNFNESDVWIKHESLPEIVLVRKSYSDRKRRKRAWQLKRIATTTEDGVEVKRRMDDDMDAFMQEIEEDPDLRANVTLYKDARQLQAVQDEEARAREHPDEYAPAVALADLLDKMTLDDAASETGSVVDPADDLAVQQFMSEQARSDQPLVLFSADALPSQQQLSETHQLQQQQMLAQQTKQRQDLHAAHAQHEAAVQQGLASGTLTAERAQAEVAQGRAQLQQYESEMVLRHQSEQQALLARQSAEAAQLAHAHAAAAASAATAPASSSGSAPAPASSGAL